MRHFTTSTDTMCHHSQLCKLALAHINDDDDNQEESNIDDNSKDDDDFMFG